MCFFNWVNLQLMIGQFSHRKKINNIITVLRILELILAFICLILHHQFVAVDRDTDTLSAGAFFGDTIILVGLVGARLWRLEIHRTIEMFFIFIGCIVFFTAGAFNFESLDDWTRKSKTEQYCTAKGCLAIINGFVMFVDCVLLSYESVNKLPARV